MPSALRTILAVLTAAIVSATFAASAAAEPFVKTPKRAKLVLEDSRFGPVIHEQRTGLVAYIFTKERGKKSRCYGRCAKAWPPIKTKKRPVAGKGLKKKDLGSSKRRGGGKIVTYKGQPLYFYEHDEPGLILCHDVFEFGGDWFVIGEDGDPA